MSQGIAVRAAALIFFFSGTSSLIFQVIWSRMLSHVFGSTGVAISTVVTIFMGGLGLGAWLAGRYADRIRHPIFTYGITELSVGLWALLVPLLLRSDGLLSLGNRWLQESLGADSMGFMLARFLFVLPVLLVPTTLMGASLPLLSRHLVQQGAGARSISIRVGWLYAINTLGAVGGVLLASFVLLPSVGLHATNLAAVGLNLSLFLGIFLYRGRLLGPDWSPGTPIQWRPAPPSSSRALATELVSPLPADRSLDTPVTLFARRCALVAFAVSGAVALCMEVVWSRALSMTIGSSVYAFGLILATFLLGLAGGSALASGALTPRRASRLVSATAALLIILPSALWAAAVGPGAALGVSAACVCLIVLLSQGKRFQGGASLWLLLAPLAVSLVTAWQLTELGAMPWLVAGVVTTMGLFLAGCVAARRLPVLLLALLQLFIAGAAILNLATQDDIPCAFSRLVSAGGVSSLTEHVRFIQGAMFLTAGLCMLPVTLGMGAMFPLTLRLWTRGGHYVGRDVGVVYVWNTMGSIVGAWLPAFILIPLLGLQQTLALAVLLNLVMAALLLFACAYGGPRLWHRLRPDGTTWRAPVQYLLGVLALASLPPLLAGGLYAGLHSDGPASLRWDRARMSLGVFRMGAEGDACRPGGQTAALLYYGSGVSTTVTVEQWGGHVSIKNNGKVDASNGDDMPTQIALGAYPLLFSRRPYAELDVAVIGWGSGVTVGTALSFPIRSLQAIELERRVLEASWWFKNNNHLNYTVTAPPDGQSTVGAFPYVEMDRLQVINDDGRNHLAATRQQFDVIISEPSNPWITGVSDLFTTDHFRITRQRLRPGGIYCQWVQLYELSPENIKIIYRTFASQFEHVLVLAADHWSSDTILLGSDVPFPLDWQHLQSRMQPPGIAEELYRAHVSSPFDLLSRLLLIDHEEVDQFTQVEHRRVGGDWVLQVGATNGPDSPCGADCRRTPVVLNTDDNAHIEFSAPHDLIGFSYREDYIGRFYDESWPWGRLPEQLNDLGDGEAASAQYSALALALLRHGRRSEADAFLSRATAATSTPQSVAAGRVAALLAPDASLPLHDFGAPQINPQGNPKTHATVLAELEQIEAHRMAGAVRQAVALMEDPSGQVSMYGGPALHALYASLRFRLDPSDPDVPILLEEIISAEPAYADAHPGVYHLLAMSQASAGYFEFAVPNLQHYVALVPEP